MAQAHSTPPSSKSLSADDWFLVANKDSLSIKIKGAITIGEDAMGLLMLNSADTQEHWLTLSVDPAGHLEAVQLKAGFRLEAPGQWSTTTPGAILPHGTVIALPNNELYVSHDLQRGRAVLKARLSRVEESAGFSSSSHELPPPVPPATIVVPEIQLTTRSAEEPAPLKQVDPPLLDVPVVRERAPDSEPAQPTSVREPAPVRQRRRRSEPVQPSAHRPVDNEIVGGVIAARHGRNSTNIVASIAGILILVVLVGGGFYVTERLQKAEAERAAAEFDEQPILERIARSRNDSRGAQATPFDNPAGTIAGGALDNDEPTNNSLQVTQHDGDSSAALAEVMGARTADELTSAAASEAQGDTADPPVTNVALTDKDNTTIDAELARARQLLNSGFINWPPDQNAATVLGNLLAQYPDNPVALQLLDDAAVQMMIQAQSAYRDGFEDSAIRVLEEVMVFHPSFEPAKSLHAEWMIGRQVQFLSTPEQADDRRPFVPDASF